MRCVLGGRSVWDSVLYYWLVQNRKTKDGIGSVISVVWRACIKGIKGLEGRRNGRIILDGCFGMSSGARLLGLMFVYGGFGLSSI